ncbi:MAG: ABC-type transport system involved in cytochrome c biosis, permease component [Acidimicrobiales bacterium]|nr:ABC-type transport system involved in cytochrome c biosis, permease component [Acidimicrobiales bacterium]
MTGSGIGSRVLGALAVVSAAVLAVLALVVTPADVNQQDAVRLIYIHVPAATTMYVAFGITALASVLYLLPRTRARRWDLLAGAAAEVGVVFVGLTLVTGSIWGRTTWGVWWTWDARLTTTAVLFVVFLGYLALRRVGGDSDARARRNSIAALAAFVDVPIVHKSVEWWRTLHQKSTAFDEETFLHPHIHGIMWWTVMVGFVTFLLVFSWLLVQRYRLAVLEERVEDESLEQAIAERRAEALTGAP